MSVYDGRPPYPNPEPWPADRVPTNNLERLIASAPRPPETPKSERRVALVAAPAVQLDADNLPPLPDLRTHLGVKVHDYTAEQVRQAQSEAQAAALAKYCGADVGGTQLITRLMTEVNDLRKQNVEYAERIRHLERELAELREVHRSQHETHVTLLSQSLAYETVARGGIDDLMRIHAALGFGPDDTIDADKMIERIDGRTAGTALDAAPEAKLPLPILYRFDRYKGAYKLAEGVGVHSTSMAEAIEKAHEVARTTGMPTDGVEIRFSNNDPCAPACRCSICDRAAAPSTHEGAK